ncbi:MAG: class I SAM-dependent methyltransferase, partial [bacterium]|nr:class I SAM-dependent methyltransferase [bacterium]
MPKDCILRTRCRICDKSDFVKILDLGKMPSANAFLKEEELSGQEKKFPLVVYFCGNCGLLQLLDVVNPSILFKHYDYLTSASKPLAQHFLESGKQLVKKFGVLKDDLVIEIGGNDGILLANIKDVCRVLNIEPADNIAPLSRQRGVETINSFFSSSLAEKILKDYGRASLIIAN